MTASTQVHSFSIRLPLFAILVPLLLLAATESLAQSQTSGSIYSRFGVGMRSTFHSAKSHAMGGGGAALKSVDYTNHLNPASLSDQVLTRLAGGFTVEGLTASANGSEDSRLSSGYLSALQLSFPLQAGKLGVGLSFEPFTRVGYRVDTAGSAIIDPDDGTVESYSTSFKGNGGIQRLSIGLGVLLTRGLSVGIRSDFLFGILEQVQETNFLSNNLRDDKITSATRLSGLTATVGVRYVLRNLLNERDQLSFGAAYTLPVSLSGSQVLAAGSGEAVDTLGQRLTGDVDLPMLLAVGVSYQPNPRWTVIADMEYEEWSQFSSTLPLPGYQIGAGGGFRDRVRVSAGVEYYPGATSTFSSFFEQLKFRIGAYSDKHYVSPSGQSDINSYGFMGGLSIPSLSVGTSLDINVEVGRRGTTDFGLIQDKFVRIGINLSFGERWFDRARLL